MPNLRRAALTWLLPFASLSGVVGMISRAEAQTVPPFADQCPLSQIERPCITQYGAAGTCVAAACEYTPDGGATVSCQECAMCLASSSQFPRCTDTIACAPGFYCFVYGDPEFLGTAGSVLSSTGYYTVSAREANCLEGGAGPQYAPAWSPCDAGLSQWRVGSAPDAGSNVGTPVMTDSGPSGATGEGTSSGAVASSGAGPGSGTGLTSGGLGGSVAAPAVPAGSGGTDAGAGRSTVDLVQGAGGCDIAAPAAATSIPWLALAPLWILRRRRARTSSDVRG